MVEMKKRKRADESERTKRKSRSEETERKTKEEGAKNCGLGVIALHCAMLYASERR